MIDKTPSAPSEHVLRRVALDNIRDNQIGGLTDGVTEDVGRDLGFTVDPEGVKQVIVDRERDSLVESADGPSVESRATPSPFVAIKATLEAAGTTHQELPRGGYVSPEKDFINRRRRSTSKQQTD